MELIDILKDAQNLGISLPDAVFIWFLYRMEKSLGIMKASNEVLTDTLLRLVPGFKMANDEAKRASALKVAEN